MHIIVAITGASGTLYAKRFVERISKGNYDIAKISIVLTDTACKVAEYELGSDWYRQLLGSEYQAAHQNGDSPATATNSKGQTDEATDNRLITVYNNDDLFASIASGSAAADAMVVIPCSMGTVGRIASGVSTDLLTRAADVMLKERRRLVIVPRETPLSLIHLQNMTLLTQAGAVIAPASPSFYSHPTTIAELVDTVVERVARQCGIQLTDSYCWSSR